MIKERLKLLKVKLKRWNKECFGDLNKLNMEVVNELNEVDKKDEESGLSEEEIVLRRKLLEEFWKVSTKYEFLMHQKSKKKWIKEGDDNTKFFHSTINGRKDVSLVGFGQ